MTLFFSPKSLYQYTGVIRRYDMRRPNIKLKGVLMEIGWRQKTLSAKTALNESLISLIISGRVVPSTAEMEAIATALSCDPAELFDGLLR